MKTSTRTGAWLFGVVLLGLATVPAGAETRIAVLNFELNDLTGITPIPREEMERTASLAPLLRGVLAERGGYSIIPIGDEEQAQANSGFGYLYEHPDEAARLGRRFGADITVVGRIHKPSLLFAYLKIRLVDVGSGRPLGERVVEIKGSSGKVTGKGVARLADQIDEALK